MPQPKRRWAWDECLAGAGSSDLIRDCSGSDQSPERPLASKLVILRRSRFGTEFALRSPDGCSHRAIAGASRGPTRLSQLQEIDHGAVSTRARHAPRKPQYARVQRTPAGGDTTCPPGPPPHASLTTGGGGGGKKNRGGAEKRGRVGPATRERKTPNFPPPPPPPAGSSPPRHATGLR